MDINSISPYIRVAWDSKVEAPWHMKERVIFDYEILFVKSGYAEIIIDSIKYDANPGDIFLFRPKESHSIQICGSEAFHQPHIHFDLFYDDNSEKVKVSFKSFDQMEEYEKELFRKDALKDLNINIPSKIVLENTDYFERTLNLIIQEFQGKKPFYEITVKGLLTDLLTYLFRENYYKNNTIALGPQKNLESIRLYLISRAKESISLDDISQLFNISKYHLVRLFKKIYGVTPMHYFMIIKIEEAKKFLTFSDLNVTEIAYMLGFESVHSFSRSFSNLEGISPSMYRKELTKKY
jgi:AraC-like DNA-binding protein